MEMRVAGKWPFGTLWKLAAAVTTVRVRGRVVHRDRVCVSLSGWGEVPAGRCILELELCHTRPQREQMCLKQGRFRSLVVTSHHAPHHLPAPQTRPCHWQGDKGTCVHPFLLKTQEWVQKVTRPCVLSWHKSVPLFLPFSVLGSPFSHLPTCGILVIPEALLEMSLPLGSPLGYTSSLYPHPDYPLPLLDSFWLVPLVSTPIILPFIKVSKSCVWMLLECMQGKSYLSMGKKYHWWGREGFSSTKVRTNISFPSKEPESSLGTGSFIRWNVHSNPVGPQDIVSRIL